MKEIKVVELFGGIGAIRKALLNLNVNFKVTDYIENDKRAVAAYNALYDENFQPVDVRDFSLPDEQIDILMHGSPCQDFSNIGKRKGGEKGSGTRSSLLFETIRIIDEAKIKPKVVIWENVPSVRNKAHIDTFNSYLQYMENMGYSNSYKVLNAIDYGVPQNRSRIFVVSIYKDDAFDFDMIEKKNAPHLRQYLEESESPYHIVTQKSLLEKIANRHIRGDSFSARAKILDDYAHTITTKQMRIPNAGFIQLGEDKYRYLTERECFRLMGFSDDDYDRLEKIFKRRKGCMIGRLYRLAGNSIVVDVLMALLKAIFDSNVIK